MDASEFEGESFGAPGPVIEPEWQRPAEAEAVAQLSQAISRNIDTALELLKAKDEIANLRHQLALARGIADDLAELVAMYNRVFEAILPQVGNGAKAAIEQALITTDSVPAVEQDGTFAGVVERGIEALFRDVAGMDGVEMSPLELFRAQQVMISAWRSYVNRGQK